MDLWHTLFGILIMCLSVAGVVINIVALVILSRKRLRTAFLQLLKMLSVYDLLVVLGGALTYGLPNVWPEYGRVAVPKLSPVLVPMVHIALMTSVYLTVLISFERYVRICYLCQLLDSRLVTERHLRVYKLAVLLFPVAFYLPKFFEVRWENVQVYYNKTVDCTAIIYKAIHTGLRPIHQPDDESLATAVSTPAAESDADLDPMTAFTDSDVKEFLQQCLQLSINVNITGNVSLLAESDEQVVEIVPTALRESQMYYRIYCVGFNTLFSSVIPLLALVYLNINTVRALSQMSRPTTPVRTRAHSTASYNTTQLNGMAPSDPEAPRGRRRILNLTSLGVSLATKLGRITRAGAGRRDKNLELVVHHDTVSTSVKSHSSTVERDATTAGDVRESSFSNGKYLSANATTEAGGIAAQGLASPNCSEVTNLSQQSPFELVYRKDSVFFEEEEAEIEEMYLDEQPQESPAAGQDQDEKAQLPRGQAVARSYSEPAKDEEEMECNGQVPLQRIKSVPPSGCRAATPSPLPLPRSSALPPSEHAQERRLARISISIVWLFMFCHVWKAVPTIYEVGHSSNGLDVEHWPDWLVIMEHLSHTLITFNSAVNFLIYVIH